MSDRDDKSIIMIIVIAVAVIMLSMVIGGFLYNINDRSLMSKNISEAVAKGMDPLSVRCAYNNDTICMIYAASGKK